METKCKCKACGAVFEWGELRAVTVYEDYGDVCCYQCPNCRRVEYDGMEMFEEAPIDENMV